MNRTELEKYISTIHSTAKRDLSNTKSITNEVVSDYYSKSSFYYRKFHSSDGAMHLPISFSDDISHDIKLRYQAEFINQMINEHGYVNVLELGCGMGFNIRYIAQKNPNVSFSGFDLTPSNIAFAKQKALGLDNITFKQADFDDIEWVKDKFDLIFAVETLCHSKNLSKLLVVVDKKLKKNGKLIIFDGYVKNEQEKLSDVTDIKAYKLLTWGFALKDFQRLSEVIECQNESDLELESLNEYSKNVLSNLRAFERGAKKALKFPILLKVLLNLRIIPMAFIKQLAAGVTAPHFIDNNYLGYYKIVFKKSSRAGTTK